MRSSLPTRSLNKTATLCDVRNISVLNSLLFNTVSSLKLCNSKTILEEMECSGDRCVLSIDWIQRYLQQQWHVCPNVRSNRSLSVYLVGGAYVMVYYKVLLFLCIFEIIRMLHVKKHFKIQLASTTSTHIQQNYLHEMSFASLNR